jgi:hypothetical protein
MSVCKHLLGLAFWRYGWAVAVVIAYSVSYAQPARATWISVYVLAPTPPVSLLSVEKHGTDPRFKKEFSIHYDLVEQLIPDEIKKKVDSSKEGTAGCPTFACPDLHWKISIKSGFAFTDKGQPEITPFGDPLQQFGINITAHAQVKLNFDIDSQVEAKGFGSGTSHSPHEFLINIDAAGKLDLWPTLQSQVSEVKVSDSDGFVFDLTDPQGFSYFHLGPLSGGYCFVEPGTCEDGRKQMEAQVNKRLFTLLKMVEEQVGGVVRIGTDAGVPQAVNLKDQLLSTKLPVVNKSFQELSDSFGLALNVQVTPPWNVNLVATLRFSGAAGSAKLNGKIRLPQERCTYLSGVGACLSPRSRWDSKR